MEQNNSFQRVLARVEKKAVKLWDQLSLVKDFCQGCQMQMAYEQAMRLEETAEGWFRLCIPALLPKKGSGSADYIRSFLYPAMQEYFHGKEPVRFTDCVLAYRHVYSRDRPERRMRDHDNIETNMVSDIVAVYVMPDDAPSVCSHYECSVMGEDDQTEVYVIPKADFPLWLIQKDERFGEEENVHEKTSETGKKDM